MQTTDQEYPLDIHLQAEDLDESRMLRLLIGRLQEAPGSTIMVEDFDFDDGDEGEDFEPEKPLSTAQDFHVKVKTEPDSLERRVNDIMCKHGYQPKFYLTEKRDNGKIPLAMQRVGITKGREGVGYTNHIMNTAREHGEEVIDELCALARERGIYWEDLIKEVWDKLLGEILVRRSMAGYQDDEE